MLKMNRFRNLNQSVRLEVCFFNFHENIIQCKINVFAKNNSIFAFLVKNIENEIIIKLVYYNLSIGIIKRHFGEDE